MHKTLTLSLAALAVCAGSAAVAQAPAGAEVRGTMRGAEQTRESVEQRAGTMFARLDLNGDGEISPADREARAERRFDKMDADGDGAISREEFTALRENRTAQREERRAARQARSGEAGERGVRGGERMARNEGRRGAGRAMRGGRMGGAGAILRQADADSNGAISQAEFTTAMLARFDAADADKDGTVTREERRNARPEGRGAGRRAQGRMIG